MNQALQYLCKRTNTNSSEWQSLDGIPSGVGSEFWYKNKDDGREAYICVDQSEITTCTVQDEE